MDYEVDILYFLQNIVPKPWLNFVEKCFEDLKDIKENQKAGEYNGAV